MADIFISHAEEDMRLAVDIADAMEKTGFSAWYYERDTVPGKSYLLQIGGEIETCRAVILLISSSSLSSYQVTQEIIRAYESNKPFIPLLINVSHSEFQTRQPEWRAALGATASLRIPEEGIHRIVTQITKGLFVLGIQPAEHETVKTNVGVQIQHLSASEIQATNKDVEQRKFGEMPLEPSGVLAKPSIKSRVQSSMKNWDNTIAGDNVNIRYKSSIEQSTYPERLLFPPRLVSTLYGRADIFTRIIEEICEDNPVVLHGMAGVGKSALASAIAWSLMEKYRNGVLWIDGGYNPIDTMCDSVGQQFEDEQMPRLSASAKPSRARYLLGTHRVLVVLDDCWDTDVAREFARTCIPAGVGLLVTSREKIARLGTLIEIRPLGNRAGVELFRHTAEVDTYEDVKAISDLVALLGGHPQALSIAGALCLEEELSTIEVLKLLIPSEERIKRLKLGKDASNNVWATFDLSYQRLQYEEQIVFRALGGSWAKSATAEMLSMLVPLGLDTIENALRGLVKRALARSERLADSRRRYIVHDLIHAFAQGLLQTVNQPIDELYNDWLDAAVKYVNKYKDETKTCHDALEAELENLIGSTNWASEHLKNKELDTIAHVLCSESGFLYRRGYNTQALCISHQAVNAARTIEDEKNEGIHLGNLGYAYSLLSNYSQAIECYQHALEIARLTSDKFSEGKWLGLIALTYDNVSEYCKAIDFYKEALRCDRAIGNAKGEGRWLGSLAGIYRTLGDNAKAIDLFSRAIELAQTLGDQENECIHLFNLGNAYRTWGKYKEALAYYNQAFTIALEIGDRATQARSLVNEGRVLARVGQPLEGLEKCKVALEIFSEIGFKSGEAYAYGYIGEVMKVLGKTYEAREATRQALAIHREVGVRNAEAEWLHNLGCWALDDGNKEEGIAVLREALQIRQELGTMAVHITLEVLKRVEPTTPSSQT